ncbi:MAG: hypothetical protein E7667_06120 [Ruminococcaceae bacterium]|nr:hypothetical protein [Oscillospiraceae bacterium]
MCWVHQTDFKENRGSDSSPIKIMKYTHTYTTRWHDTDANRVLRASRILVYFQETGNIQCQKFGLPLDELRDERGVGFILSQISFKVYRPIRAFESINVSTWCKEAKGYSFYRYFDICVDGELCAQASSVWALVDVNNKTLVRADESLAPHFPYDEPIDAELLPPRARVGRDEKMQQVGQRKIAYSDIDYNMHMNNTNYPDMLCDFIPDMEGKYVSEMSLTYLKEAPLGAVLDVFCSQREDGRFVFKTQNKNGETCLEATVKLENI